VQRFDFHFASVYRVAARPFGITPDRAWVQAGLPASRVADRVCRDGMIARTYERC
jgi:hypothetical protein